MPRIPWLSQGASNQAQGKFFEEAFRKECLSRGLWPIKNEISCRRVGMRWQPLKSHLDFTVVTKTGDVGFFDCKAFNRIHFTYSDIDSTQLARAIQLNESKVPSGFVVWLEKLDWVVYYSGLDIQRHGRRLQFGRSQGTPLGRLSEFDTRLLFSRDPDMIQRA